MSTDELFSLANKLGVSIQWHSAGPAGYYTHHTKVISLRKDLRGAMLRCTLAHELAHAMRGDQPTHNDWADKRMERAADQLAATMLISKEEYAETEDLHGPNPAALAHNLGITKHMLEVWQETYERTRI